MIYYMSCRKIQIEQLGGYPAGFRLRKETNDKKRRYERIFTQVFADGSTEGRYIGYDYSKTPADGKYQMQGTSWLSAVKKAYRESCTEFREIYRLGRIMEDYDLSNLEEAEDVYAQMSKDDKAFYQEEGLKVKCEPMEIMMREITPGNNKMDFNYRQRKYYVISNPIKPKSVSPSTGSTARVYRFLPKVYPMQLGETVEEFRKRKNL